MTGHVVLLADGANLEALRGLGATVVDVVPADSAADVVTSSIRAALRSLMRPGSPRIQIDAAARQVRIDDEVVGLTTREVDLLLHLCRYPGEVLSRRELLLAVWQSSPDWQTAATVTEHVRRLRIKLGERGVDAGITTVRGVGYRYDGVRLIGSGGG